MCSFCQAFGANTACVPNLLRLVRSVRFGKMSFHLLTRLSPIRALEVPNPETDGLLPFMLNRLVKTRPAIQAAGHDIRFSVSRGPLNIASFLMGTTEFLTTMMMDPEATHQLLRTITDFLKRWHALQHETFDSIDGIMMLDDIVGFISEEDFKEFAYPYLKELYDTSDSVKLFHNDADCTVSVKYYPELGINLYNPGVHRTLTELRAETNDSMAILGNIPPRDVLAAGTPEIVAEQARLLRDEAAGFSRMLFSCGGGMPPGVTTENITAFIKAVQG